MTKKLLNTTLHRYLVLNAIILLISAPIFYIATEQLYLEDIDEALLLRKNEFLTFHQKNISLQDIPTWNKYNRDVTIEPNLLNLSRDQIFQHFYYDELADENEPYRVLQTPITISNELYILNIKINLMETEDLILSIAIVFFCLMLFLSLGLYLTTRNLSLKLWKPFYETLEHIEQFEIDKNKTVTFPESRIDEFNRLNQSIEKLIQKNTTIYNSQKEFIENAAHELQTPLAVFQGKLESLIQDFNPNEQQATIFLQLHEAVTRLKLLNKNLLLLSRIENKQFGAKETVIWNELTEKRLAFFEEQADSKKIKLHIDIPNEISIETNPFLAEILFSNLFLNAIKHNIEGGTILIKLTSSSLSFANTGDANALPQELLFRRFSKTDSSTKGTGLGLSIVKKIADQNNWTISYSFENNLHVFLLTF